MQLPPAEGTLAYEAISIQCESVTHAKGVIMAGGMQLRCATQNRVRLGLYGVTASSIVFILFVHKLQARG